MFIGHDTFRRRKDRDPQPVIDTREFVGARIPAETGFADAPNFANDGLTLIVLQVHAQRRLSATVAIEKFVIGDIALVFENLGDSDFELRCRCIYSAMVRSLRVANPR